jgi:polyphosphate glucokinase
MSSGPIRTLSIDIGGTGTKMLVLDETGHPVTERTREPTPQPAKPSAVLALIEHLAKLHEPFDRVSVGFPGVVKRGVVKTAPNLDTQLWHGYAFETEVTNLLGRPTRIVNDADLQGYGVIQGRGVEMVITLGTGMGAALFINGHLYPNLELGHHPLKKNKTYEQLVCEAELDRIGKKRWSKRVADAIAQMEPIFNYDLLHLGGGNAKKIKVDLPDNVVRFENVAGLRGGIRLWEDEP